MSLLSCIYEMTYHLYLEHSDVSLGRMTCSNFQMELAISMQVENNSNRFSQNYLFILGSNEYLVLIDNPGAVGTTVDFVSAAFLGINPENSTWCAVLLGVF